MHKYIDVCRYPMEELKRSREIFSLDTETLGPTRATNIPIYYSWASREFGAGAGPTTTTAGHAFIKALCEAPNPKVIQNAKFDIRVLENYICPVKGEIHDTILMHMLIDEHHLEHHRLKVLARELLDRPRMDAWELKKAQQKVKFNSDVPQEVMHPYALADSVDCLDLFYLFKPQIEEMDMWELYRQEVQVELIYKEIEENGVAINMDAIDEVTRRIGVAADELAQELYKAFGEKFLISSTQQLGNVLAKHFRLREKTDTGLWKTDKETLRRFITDPRMQKVFAYKFLTKAQSTIAGYKKREKAGRLHPSYRQTTIPGRCACKDPNLTTIPKQRGRITEVEVGSVELAEVCGDAFRQVRKIFVAPPGSRLVAFDYKQVEYRCFVLYSGSERLIARLRAGEDFHTMVCQIVFGEVTPRLRHIIKIINFGLLYGMGPGLFHRTLRVEGINPHGLLETYEKNLPEMRATQSRMITVGRKRGYVKDAFGRRYRFLNDKPHAIVAWACQGYAANIKKTAMTRIDALPMSKSKMVMDIHDELDFEMYPEDASLLPTIKQRMEDFPQLKVPFPVDVSVGKNFLEMKDMKIEEAVFLLKGIENGRDRLAS